MTKLMPRAFFAIVAIGLFAGTALAKGGTPQNHHCAKDGAVVENKTKKECLKDGGKWEKDAPKAAEGAPAPAAGDAKKEPAKEPAADKK